MIESEELREPGQGRSLELANHGGILLREAVTVPPTKKEAAQRDVVEQSDEAHGSARERRNDAAERH